MTVAITTRGRICPGNQAVALATHGLICQFAEEDLERPLDAPLHITEVTSGMVLRISMKAGRHLDPIQARTFTYQTATIRRQRGEPFPEPPPAFGGMTRMRAATKRKRTGNRARAFSRTVFMAYVVVNDTENGVLTVNIEDRTRNKKSVPAIIAYSDMLRVQRAIHQLILRPEAGSRPGSVALGSRSDFGFQKLVPVRFRR